MAKDELLKHETFSARVLPLSNWRVDLLLMGEGAVSLQQGSELLGAARREADKIRELARQEGLADGLRQVAELIEEAERKRQDILEQAEEDIVSLALAAAEKLVGREITGDPKVLVGMVEIALNEATSARRITVYVDPDTVAHLKSVRQSLTRKLGVTTLRIQAEVDLQPGDCIIETEAGRIDARLDLQLETLRRALLGDDS